MALVYKGNNAARQAARSARMMQTTQNIMNKMSQRQKAKNDAELKLRNDADLFTQDFYKKYGDIENSSSAEINNSIRAWALETGAEQNRLYQAAYGANGTPENRQILKDQQLKDQAAVKDIASWMAIGNKELASISSNNSAIGQDVMDGRFTRGNDDKRLAFQQDLQQSKFASLKMTRKENGQMVLMGLDKDGEVLDNRNLSSDVADQAAGNTWYETITKDDLLRNTLANNWNDKNTGLSQFFEPTKRTVQTYDSKGGYIQEVVEEAYDTQEVFDRLVSEYSNDLNAEIKNPNFSKTWDQLWKGGYLKSAEGESMEEGEIAWKDVKRLEVMDEPAFQEFAMNLGYGDADVNEDGIVNNEDRKHLVDRMYGAARVGLAQYYSKEMAPRGNKVLSSHKVNKNNVPQGNEENGQYSAAQQLVIKAEKPIWNKLHAKAPSIFNMPENERANAIVQWFNSSALHKVPSKQGVRFMTGSQINAMKRSDKEFKRKNSNDIYKIVGKDAVPAPIMTEADILQSDLREFERAMEGMAGLSAGYTNLFHQSDKGDKSVKVFNTKEEAKQAAGPNGKVFAGTGKNKGKFTIKS
ncbi:MAG: hypothetical protein CMJ25_09570 [Phycisphaerae bacterium]|nr:hypothetical protein [Phycisphaerae bacterium]|tara:strand:- start:1071 stop:2816 length:1746 start_codon:yes stop_codon:yes gene_type:complete